MKIFILYCLLSCLLSCLVGFVVVFFILLMKGEFNKEKRQFKFNFLTEEGGRKCQQKNPY